MIFSLYCDFSSFCGPGVSVWEQWGSNREPLVTPGDPTGLCSPQKIICQEAQAWTFPSVRTEGPRRLRPCEGACLCAGEVPEYRWWAGVSVSIFCVPQTEVRCGGGCRDRMGIGRRNAIGATAQWPPGFSLPVLGTRDEVLM